MKKGCLLNQEMRWEKKAVRSPSFPYRAKDFWVSNEEKVESLAEMKTGHAASVRE